MWNMKTHTQSLKWEKEFSIYSNRSNHRAIKMNTMCWIDIHTKAIQSKGEREWTRAKVAATRKENFSKRIDKNNNYNRECALAHAHRSWLWKMEEKENIEEREACFHS